MKINKTSGFLISLSTVIIAGFLLMLTGIWYTVVIAGIIAAMLIRKGYTVSALSSFSGGIISMAVFLLTLPTSYLFPTMNEVASISGISATILLALMFLITALLALAGALLGTFVAMTVIREHASPA